MFIERGPAKYFHGRKAELRTFDQLLNETKQYQIGSSVLIQGPPGVGKTALIEEHEKQARKKNWQVFKLSNECLSDPKELFTKLTKKAKPKEFEKTFGFDLHIFKGNLTKKSIPETNAINESIILSKPTMLWLDEVQTLEDFLEHVDKPKITSFLNTYHNLKSKKGFIFLLGGLGHSQEILRQLGISRFNTGCIHYLQPLEPQAERQILHDWLTRELKTPSGVTRWIDQITQQTDQWPRHIKSYCNAIFHFLDIGESLTDRKLKQVMNYGHEFKQTYYQQRCHGLEYENRQLVASTLNRLPDWFSKRNIVDLFSKSLFEKASEVLYQKILSKGIIHLDEQGKLSVPIPSLRTFLIHEYGLSNR